MILLVTGSLFITTGIGAQNLPYSSFGLRDPQPMFPGNSHGMGGISSALQSENYLNPKNPASYSYLKWTTLQAGISGRLGNLKTNDSTYSLNNALLEYLTFGIPIGEKGGAAVGLMPYSRTGYTIRNRDTLSNGERLVETFAGNGSLYQFFLGGSYRIKDLSFGVNAAYLFGNLNNTVTASFPDVTHILSSRKQEELYISSIIFRGGLQYRFTLGNGSLTAGLNGSMPRTIEGEKTFLWERYQVAGGFIIPEDTIANDTLSGNIELPSELAAGLMYKNKKLKIGGDFTFAGWSNYSAFNKSPGFADSWSMRLGGSVTPDPEAIESYLKKTEYRFGVYYISSHLDLRNVIIKDYGITFGVGLPVRMNRSTINLAFKAGSRGTTENNLIKENYFKLIIDFTLNDKWFIKRKFD